MQKVWFITGASRGFGFEITKTVLSFGDKVIATVRNNENELKEKFNNNENLHVLKLDVTNEKQAIMVTNHAIAIFGKIDVLVNNAGYGLLAAIEEASSVEVKEVFETNVFGTLNVIRAVLPHMRKENSGHIINISSIGGLKATAGWGIYGATKFAIEGITEALAQELISLNVKATVVAPGFFRTNFLDQSSLTRTNNIIDDYKETVGKTRDLATDKNHKQIGDPKKLAQALVQIVYSKNPPLHLLLGRDTIDRFKEKTIAIENDINQWYDVVTETNFII
jgi:NAD(P)-dependent dehydrogenase (short-subunit alcohol dehydrogenase family)